MLFAAFLAVLSFCSCGPVEPPMPEEPTYQMFQLYDIYTDSTDSVVEYNYLIGTYGDSIGLDSVCYSELDGEWELFAEHFSTKSAAVSFISDTKIQQFGKDTTFTFMAKLPIYLYKIEGSVFKSSACETEPIELTFAENHEGAFVYFPRTICDMEYPICIFFPEE